MDISGSRVAYLALVGFTIVALIGAFKTRGPERARATAIATASAGATGGGSG
ncbi:MAG: hypothetical protein HY678_05215 [Chloroflexi bacterium]|nr:hypothetical protein [Chloroflexota bacterium]